MTHSTKTVERPPWASLLVLSGSPGRDWSLDSTSDDDPGDTCDCEDCQ